MNASNLSLLSSGRLVSQCLRLQRINTSPICLEERELWRLDQRNRFVEIPEAWVTSLSAIKPVHKSIIKLHPDVFRVPPRLDLLHKNTVWQENYRNLQLTKMLSRAEMPGGGKKPWPQKKTGRHHAGSIRSPGFYRGGFAHGVKGPRTWFYMLPDSIRLKGLCVALTLKHAQDDLVIVDNFSSLPIKEPYPDQYLMDLADARNWGYSMLFVDLSADNWPSGVVEAARRIPSLNLMPLYGLNCYSIVKHETLVISRRALDALEKGILSQLNRTGTLQKKFKYYEWKDKLLAEGENEEDPYFPPFV